MFSFFQKKIYLKDLLEDYIDIHNHILPGIDDGAATTKDSLALIAEYEKLGIKKFISTPHIMNDYYPNNPQTIHSALDSLKSELDNSDKKVEIRAAAEYMMDQSFIELLEAEKLLCLYQNYILVEMSYFQAPINLNEILFKLQTQQYRPVLAHPERYVYFHSRDLENYHELKRRGCLFQLNILSITGHYGSNIKEAAFDLLKNGLIDFIGTDTHQMRHIEKLLQSQIPEKKAKLIRPIIERTKSTFLPAFS